MSQPDFTAPSWWDRVRFAWWLFDAGADRALLLELHDRWVQRFRRPPPSKRLRAIAERRMHL